MAYDGFNQVNYLIRKKIFKIFGQEFHIYDREGQLRFYSKLKAFKLKEDIRIYTGEDMQNEVLHISARNVIDFSGTYDVTDSTTNEKVGALKRKGFTSIIKDEWIIFDKNDNEVGLLMEDSMLMALLRRFLTNLIPQKFSGFIGDAEVCTFEQNFNPFVSKINVDFSMDKKGLLDRRLGMAAGILLGAIEKNQK